MGAGYAGLRAALDIDRLSVGVRQCSIQLIDPRPAHELVVALHELATGRIAPSKLLVPIMSVIGGRRIVHVPATVVGFDLAQRLIMTDHATYPYDHLIIASGSTTDYFGIPGVEEYGLTLKSVEDALHIKRALRNLVVKNSRAHRTDRWNKVPPIVIGGGGFTGIELAGAIAAWVSQERERGRLGRQDAEVLVVEAGDRLLPGFAQNMARTALQALSERGVRIQLSAHVTAVESGVVCIRTGQAIDASMVVWTGGVRASHAASVTGLASGSRGRLLVDKFLRAKGRDDVSVIGDAALIERDDGATPAPPSAQLAIQHGKVVARNVVARQFNWPLTPYRTELLGEVIALGPQNAVANVGGIELRGAPAVAAKRLAMLHYVAGLRGTAFAERYGSHLAFALSRPTRDGTLSTSKVGSSPVTAGG